MYQLEVERAPQPMAPSQRAGHSLGSAMCQALFQHYAAAAAAAAVVGQQSWLLLMLLSIPNIASNIISNIAFKAIQAKQPFAQSDAVDPWPKHLTVRFGKHVCHQVRTYKFTLQPQPITSTLSCAMNFIPRLFYFVLRTPSSSHSNVAASGCQQHRLTRQVMVGGVKTIRHVHPLF
jgi:hypothetical protein